MKSADGKTTVNLRNIRSPIVLFASWGDNITPPQQAINWVPDLYDSVDEIRANGQTIVYCLHEKVGHLGIFVSAKVAGREHSQIISAIDMIDILPPGLYEAKIEDTHPEMPSLELIEGRYLIKFEMRTIDDILALGDGREHERAFEVVKRVSEINQGLYDTFISPAVKAMSNEIAARWSRMLQSDRMQRYMFSDMNPMMWPVKFLAWMIRDSRKQVSSDNPFLQLESKISGQITEMLDVYRDLRDAWCESLFKLIYESPWLTASVGLPGKIEQRKGPRPDDWLRKEFKRLMTLEIEARTDHGTPLDALVRMLLYQGHESRVFDERPFRLIQQFMGKASAENRISLEELKQAFKRQSLVLLLNENKAIDALPKLLPDTGQRQRVLELMRSIATARAGKLDASQQERIRRIENLLGAESQEVSPPKEAAGTAEFGEEQTTA